MPHRPGALARRALALVQPRHPPRGRAPSDARQRSLGQLRVVEAVRKAGLEDRIGDLYTELGRRTHDHEDRSFPVTDALAACGLPLDLAGAADDDSYDGLIRASMDEASALAGDDAGVPVIAWGPTATASASSGRSSPSCRGGRGGQRSSTSITDARVGPVVHRAQAAPSPDRCSRRPDPVAPDCTDGLQRLAEPAVDVGRRPVDRGRRRGGRLARRLVRRPLHAEQRRHRPAPTATSSSAGACWPPWPPSCPGCGSARWSAAPPTGTPRSWPTWPRPSTT